jgi:WD40 repeat protein
LNPEDLSLLSLVLKEPNEAAAFPPVQVDLLLQLGVIVHLELEHPPQSGAILAAAASAHPHQSVREAAFQALCRLAPSAPEFADSLYRLAIEEDHLAARQLISSTGLAPGSPGLGVLFEWISAPDAERSIDLPLLTYAFFNDVSLRMRARILAIAAKTNRFRRWGRLVENLNAGGLDGYRQAVEQFPALTERERSICREILFKAAAVEDAAREAVFELFIQHEDSAALQLITGQGWIPADSAEQALLYFLSGQVEKHKELDFDHSLLVRIFETAAKPLRRRLLTYSRQSGQVDWLRAVSSTADVRYLSDLGDADWEGLLNRLSAGERHLDLWRLAQSAPPRWAAAILVRLSSAGWQPEARADEEIYRQLAPLAQACTRRPLDIRPRHTFISPSENITCLSFEPKYNLLAAGTTTQTIYLWDLPDGSLHFPSLSGPAPVTRALSFSPDGEYLAAAGGDQRIRLFKHTTGQIVKTLEGHRGLVRAVAIHPNGRLMVSAGFDGTLRTWRFPHGSELRRMESDVRENFALAILPENDMVASAGSGWGISVWKLADGAIVRHIPSGSDGILHLAAAHGADLVASAGRDRAISVWNIHTGLLVRRFTLHPSSVVGMAFFPGDQILATAGQDGSLSLWSVSAPDPIATLQTGEATINAMTLSTDGQTLVTASASGRINVWNFSSLLWITRPHQPGRTIPLETLEERLKLPGLPAGEKCWLDFTAALWRWSRRFDVELGDMPAVSFDPFDIEL